MGTHPIFESDFDCLTDSKRTLWRTQLQPRHPVVVSEVVSVVVARTRSRPWTRSRQARAKGMASRYQARSTCQGRQDRRSLHRPLPQGRSLEDQARPEADPSRSANRFKAIVGVGDGNGHVGLGVKCSKEVATAIRGAIILAKLSVVPIRRGY